MSLLARQLVDLSAVSRLQGYLPQIMSVALKQLSSKSIPSRQQLFVVMRQVADVLQGGLDASADPICAAATGALKSVDSATTSSLAIAALSFLSTFVLTHSPKSYFPHLGALVPAITRCMKERLQRVSVEAFSAASALASSLRPLGSASPSTNDLSSMIQKLLQATTDVLNDNSIDAEVRDRALDTLGSLLVHEGDIIASSLSSVLPLISTRLNNETTAVTAMSVIGKVATSPTCQGTQFEQWLLEILPSVVLALRRTRRASGRGTEFSCLQSVLTRVGSSLPQDTSEGIITELKPFIDTANALHIVASILQLQPRCRALVEDELLKPVFEVIKTPSVNPHLVEALEAFVGAYVDGDTDCATHLVISLVDNLGKTGSLPDATQGGTSVYTTTARLIGTVAKHSRGDTSSLVASFQKTIKVSPACRFKSDCSRPRARNLTCTLLFWLSVRLVGPCKSNVECHDSSL